MNMVARQEVATLSGLNGQVEIQGFDFIGQDMVARTAATTAQARLVAVREIAIAALEPLKAHAEARLTWRFSQLSLDAAALGYALSEWSDGVAPVHDLIALDFASDAMTTRGLGWFCGQEIRVVPSETTRRECAHLVVQLAREMLCNGAYPETVRVAAPAMPKREVLLRVTPNWVEIVP